MKESKFIELLNLYVDQEISPQEASLLEQEIAAKPERRKVYLQYCRMHRASTVLFESFKSGAMPAGKTLSEAAKKADDKVILFPAQTQTRSWRWTYAAGLTAAAACFTFVLMRNDTVAPGTGDDGETQMIALRHPHSNKPLVPMAAEQQFASVSTPAARQEEYSPVFVAKSIDPNAFREETQTRLLGRQVALDWMNQLQLQPLQETQIDSITFESKPMLRQDPRSFSSQRPVDAKVEMTAFQFER